MSEPTTQAGRALLDHAWPSPEYNTARDMFAKRIAAIEAEARAQFLPLTLHNAVLRTTLQEARELLEEWGAYASDYFREKWNLQGDLAKIDAVLADTAAAASNYLDLDSPEAERRLAKALTNLVFASSATRTERARAILAALRKQPLEESSE